MVMNSPPEDIRSKCYLVIMLFVLDDMNSIGSVYRCGVAACGADMVNCMLPGESKWLRKAAEYRDMFVPASSQMWG